MNKVSFLKGLSVQGRVRICFSRIAMHTITSYDTDNKVCSGQFRRFASALTVGCSLLHNYINSMKELTEKVKRIMRMYSEEFPEVRVDQDYYPFKITEEWGECMQAYLMYTDRGRQKGKSKEEIREMFEEEIADVFGFLILFAENEGIDLEQTLEKKWFKRLK
jgi:NTP pyrophosphatase (non-canonical NTP hydrolase)